MLDYLEIRGHSIFDRINWVLKNPGILMIDQAIQNITSNSLPEIKQARQLFLLYWISCYNLLALRDGFDLWLLHVSKNGSIFTWFDLELLSHLQKVSFLIIFSCFLNRLLVFLWLQSFYLSISLPNNLFLPIYDSLQIPDLFFLCLYFTLQ
jgi:hypothetical protein